MAKVLPTMSLAGSENAHLHELVLFQVQTKVAAGGATWYHQEPQKLSEAASQVAEQFLIVEALLELHRYPQISHLRQSNWVEVW
jgi:hypothetical protein